MHKVGVDGIAQSGQVAAGLADSNGEHLFLASHLVMAVTNIIKITNVFMVELSL